MKYFSMGLISLMLSSFSCGKKDKVDKSTQTPSPAPQKVVRWDLVELEPIDSSSSNEIVIAIFKLAKCERIPNTLQSFESKEQCLQSLESLKAREGQRSFECMTDEIQLSEPSLKCNKSSEGP
jgi:hypothetical protein